MKKKKQLLIVFGGFSGAGKTSVVECLLKYFGSRFARVITTTTRPPRKGEKNGIDYIFLSENDFDQKVDNGEFFEHATVYGHRYGTLKQSVDGILGVKKHAILNVDFQGFVSLKKTGALSGITLATLSFFVTVPTFDVLEERLRRRAKADGTSEAVILQRLAEAKLMVSQMAFYDHTIVNLVLGEAVMSVLDIIEVAEML